MTAVAEKDLQAYLKELQSRYPVEITPCGSRITCNPPPTDTDIDYLVFLKDTTNQHVADLVADLHRDGWLWEGCEHYQLAINTFMSHRRDNVNLIVTDNPHFYKQHKLATAVCRELNLMDKAQRIMLFQAILYGAFPAGVFDENSKDAFVVAELLGSGWAAVHYWWNDKEDFLKPGEGFWEPWQTGVGRYATVEEADAEAKSYAESEGIRYRPQDPRKTA